MLINVAFDLLLILLKDPVEKCFRTQGLCYGGDPSLLLVYVGGVMIPLHQGHS